MLAARDWAVRDYRTHLQAVAKRAPRTVNNALAAVDDFYTRLGLGAANATRADLPRSAPRALSRRTACGSCARSSSAPPRVTRLSG